MNKFTIVLAERLCILGNVQNEQIANDNELHERFYFGEFGGLNRFAFVFCIGTEKCDDGIANDDNPYHPSCDEAEIDIRNKSR